MSKQHGQIIGIQFSAKLIPSSKRGNVAKGCGVSSNGDISYRYETSGITNGDIDTENYTSVSNASPAYIQIDLGMLSTIDSIQVWHYFKDGRTYYSTKTEISENGIDWETIFDSDIDGTYVETAAGIMHSFEPKTARYIRDWTNGSTANTGNHWVEIQVFGNGPKGFHVDGFTIVGQEYKHVNGPLVDKIYIPNSVYQEGSIIPIDISEGVATNLQIKNGILMLAEV